MAHQLNVTVKEGGGSAFGPNALGIIGFPYNQVEDILTKIKRTNNDNARTDDYTYAGHVEIERGAVALFGPNALVISNSKDIDTEISANVKTLQSMGFGDTRQINRALRLANDDIHAAVTILIGPDALDGSGKSETKTKKSHSDNDECTCGSNNCDGNAEYTNNSGSGSFSPGHLKPQEHFCHSKEDLQVAKEYGDALSNTPFDQKKDELSAGERENGDGSNHNQQEEKEKIVNKVDFKSTQEEGKSSKNADTHAQASQSTWGWYDIAALAVCLIQKNC